MHNQKYEPKWKNTNIFKNFMWKMLKEIPDPDPSINMTGTRVEDEETSSFFTNIYTNLNTYMNYDIGPYYPNETLQFRKDPDNQGELVAKGEFPDNYKMFHGEGQQRIASRYIPDTTQHEDPCSLLERFQKKTDNKFKFFSCCNGTDGELPEITQSHPNTPGSVDKVTAMSVRHHEQVHYNTTREDMAPNRVKLDYFLYETDKGERKYCYAGGCDDMISRTGPGGKQEFRSMNQGGLYMPNGDFEPCDDREHKFSPGR